KAEQLGLIVEKLSAVASHLPLVFPIHPRTRQRLRDFGLEEALRAFGRIRALEPLSYIEFMGLVLDSRLVITDSGGVQEETSYLGIPCLTLRDNTERPVTLTLGTNRLIKPADLDRVALEVLDARRVRPSIPLWDGRTADRVARSEEH